MCRHSALLALALLITSTVEAATIRGVVRDPDGQPVPGAQIVLTGVRPGTAGATTDHEGRFQLDNVASGHYYIHVVVEGFAAEAVDIDADDSEPREVSITLRVSALSESLVVSAAQIDLPLSQTAASVTIVTAKDLENRQIRTLGDALRTVPGLSIAQNGTLGSLTSLFTRGGESDFTLVLVDGMRANAFGGGLDLSQVPLVDAERVEIVRGPQSAVFGSDAIGGVVQIVSRRCHAGPQSCGWFDASIEGGSLASARGRANAAGGGGAWTWNGQVEHAQTDGYSGTAPATGEKVTNDDARVQHAAGALGWQHDTGAELRGQVQLSFTDRGFPGPYGSNPIAAFTGVDRVSRGKTNRRQAAVLWTQPWTGPAGRIRQRSDASVTDFDGSFVSPFGASESETQRLTFRTQTDAALNTAFGVSAGVELLREQAGSTFITDATFEPIPVNRLVAGYFGEARYAPGARLSLAGGVRLDQIRRDALPANPSPFSPRPAFDDESITSVNPRVAVAYLLRGEASGPSTRLRASAGTGIRPPDAFEIAFTDNPALKPERSRSIDGGIQQTFAGGAALIDVSVFFNNYDDLIVPVGRSFRDASSFRTDNISNARSRGLELSAGVRPLATLDIHGSYTLLDTEILAVDRSTEAPAPYRVGEQLIRRPRHQGSVVGVYTRQRWTAFADAKFRGAVRDIEPTFGASGGVFDAPGFGVLNLGGSIHVTRLLDTFARVENVTDRRYEEAFGFPAPGRLLIVGVHLRAAR
jgi:outer membrane cobalamin receptor